MFFFHLSSPPLIFFKKYIFISFDEYSYLPNRGDTLQKRVLIFAKQGFNKSWVQEDNGLGKIIKY